MIATETERVLLSQESQQIKHNMHEGPYLTDRQEDVLNLMARGLSTKEIGETLGIKSNTVRAHRKGVFDSFGAANSMHAVFLALDQDKLTYEQLTDGWDKSALSKLTPKHIEVVDYMTANNGENNLNKEIGGHLHINPGTVRARLQSIRRKTKMNRMQIGILYLEAKKNPLTPQENKSPKQKVELTPRQMEVLVLIAKGFSMKETASQLQISIDTVSTHRSAIYSALGVTNSTSAFRKALEIGILNLEISRTHDKLPPPFREVVIYQRRRE